MKSYTADICDNHPNDVQVLAPNYNSYGGISMCHGQITTIQLFEDNTALVKLLRDTNGDGKICVVDVVGDYCAIVGENLMNYAHKNGWKGILINGYVRDIEATQQIPVGLWALGTYPFRSQKKKEALLNTTLEFGEVTFRVDEFLFADNDGIIVTQKYIQ